MEWLLFLAHFAVFAGVHSALASAGVKAYVFKRYPEARRFYRLGYNLLAAIWTLLLLWSVPGRSPVLWTIPWPWTFAVSIVMLWAAVEVVRSVFHLDAGEFLGIRQLRQPPVNDLDAATHARLSTTGWYARTRHPLYFFSILFLLCKPTMTAGHALLTACAACYFFYGAVREEQQLEARFGEAFRTWKAQVPMFIPRIRRRA